MADTPWNERVTAPLSFFTEEDVLKTLPKWKWLSFSVGNVKLLAMNWVVTLVASITLLTFVILSIAFLLIGPTPLFGMPAPAKKGWVEWFCLLSGGCKVILRGRHHHPHHPRPPP